jgi:hypothetical protein
VPTKLCCLGHTPNSYAAIYAAVNAANHDLSKLCFICREIDSIRKSVFNFSMSLVKRDCNAVAGELAKCNRLEGT